MAAQDTRASLHELALVGLKAMALQEAISEQRFARRRLSSAYRDYRHTIGHDLVPKESPEWAAMMEATKPEYFVLANATKKVALARRRLETACNRARRGPSPYDTKDAAS